MINVMNEEAPCNLKGWSNILFYGIPRYFEVNLIVYAFFQLWQRLQWLASRAIVKGRLNIKPQSTINCSTGHWTSLNTTLEHSRQHWTTLENNRQQWTKPQQASTATLLTIISRNTLDKQDWSQTWDTGHAENSYLNIIWTNKSYQP